MGKQKKEKRKPHLSIPVFFPSENLRPTSDYIKYNLQMEVASAFLSFCASQSSTFFNVTQATVYNCHKIDRNEHKTK